MPDFTQLLKKPLNDFKRPDTIPQGTYHGVILNYAIDESKEKKTPFIRFNCRLTGPGDDVPPEMLQKPDGSTIDVGKKTMSADFYLTEASGYRLTEALQSMGIDTADRDLSQTLPETLNQPVLLSVTLKPSNRPPAPGAAPEFFNQVDRLIGTAGSN